MIYGRSKVKPIPFEDIASILTPGNSYPTEFKFSPNSKFVTFLSSENKNGNKNESKNGNISKSLWVLNLETREKSCLFSSQTISEEEFSSTERLRRERQRQLLLGVTNYEWSEKVNKLVFKDSNGIYGVDFDREKQITKIIDLVDKAVIDPQISPDGEWIGYVFDKELFIISFDGKMTKQLTFNAKKNDVTHGIAEYVAQEEMGRTHGFWWSPDSQYIAFTEVNECHIPVFRIVHQAQEEPNKAVDEISYPFAGKENAYIKLAVVNINDLQTIWMDLGENLDIYLARVNWFSDTILTAQIENREQTILDLVKFDIVNGNSTLILQEQSDNWINLHNLLTVFDSQKLIWASERTGFRHLYLYDIQGNLLKEITKGDFLVEEIVKLNKEKGLIYVITTAKNPTQRHLYEFSMDDGTTRQISQEEGTHSITIDKQTNIYIDIFSSIANPPNIMVRRVSDNSVIFSVFNDIDPKIDEFDLKPPEIIELQLPDRTILYGAIYKPNENFGQGPYPTVIKVYGGPHPQMVSNNWTMTSDLRIQNLVKHGFLVFILDYRGSGHRGHKFESVLKGQFGKYEVEDQVFGIEWLINKGLAHKDRIGITGWSYGGYMSLMCLSKAPHIYKAAFAGAPINDVRDYDTHYTEKYLGNPEINKEGYDKTSVMNNVAGMTGKLMLAHGLIDENVHFRHTAKLINKLIELNKDYSLILFPNGRHSLRKKEDRTYLEHKILEFFLNSL